MARSVEIWDCRAQSAYADHRTDLPPRWSTAPKKTKSLIIAFLLPCLLPPAPRSMAHITVNWQ